MKATIVYLLLGSLSLSAGAAVIITRLNPPVDAGSFAEPENLYVDFNHDGISELLLYSAQGSFNSYFFTGNRIVVRSSPPPNIGGPNANLSFGTEIGVDISDPARNWFIGSYISATDPGSRPYGDRESVAIIEVTSGSPGPPAIEGDIVNQEGVMGFEFKIGDDTHYGYIHYNFTSTNGTGFSGSRGTILGWAYEDIPGKSIIAAPIPEPSSWVLIALTASAGAFLRRRRC